MRNQKTVQNTKQKLENGVKLVKVYWNEYAGTQIEFHKELEKNGMEIKTRSDNCSYVILAK